MREHACALHHWVVCDPNTHKMYNFDGYEKLHWGKLTD